MGRKNTKNINHRRVLRYNVRPNTFLVRVDTYTPIVMVTVAISRVSVKLLHLG